MVWIKIYIYYYIINRNIYLLPPALVVYWKIATCTTNGDFSSPPPHGHFLKEKKNKKWLLHKPCMWGVRTRGRWMPVRPCLDAIGSTSIHVCWSGLGWNLVQVPLQSTLTLLDCGESDYIQTRPKDFCMLGKTITQASKFELVLYIYYIQMTILPPTQIIATF
jgi:hypothetical protein